MNFETQCKIVFYIKCQVLTRTDRGLLGVRAVAVAGLTPGASVTLISWRWCRSSGALLTLLLSSSESQNQE